MKKNLIWLLVSILCLTLAFAACTASEPQITSETTSITNVYIGDEVAIPAVTATDEKDGDLTSKVTVKVVASGRTVAINDNKFVPTESGEYNIVYSVTNSSKKTGTLSIKVTVTDKIVIGYDARTVSGLTDEIIANFKVALQAYIDANFNGACIVVRGYNQTTINAVELGQQINADGDCDILLGFGSNLSTSTESSGSGVATLAKKQVPMAGKTSSSAMRYVYKAKETSISNAVYDWICTEGGDAQKSLEVPPQTKLVIGWDGRTASTGLTDEIMTNFEKALQNYLSTLADYSTIVPEYRKYTDESTQEIGNKINSAGDVDILIGFGANVNLESGANVRCAHMTQVEMGGKTRYVCQLNEGGLSALVYNWIKDGNAAEALAKPVVVVAYNSEKTYLTSELMANFASVANASLDSASVQVVGVATKQEASSADILIGFDGEGSLESVTIVAASNDNVAERVTDKQSTKDVFAWLQTTDAADSLSDIEKVTSIVIAFDMRATSGVTEQIKADVVDAFKQYLVENGYDLSTLTISTRDYTGDSSVAVGELINTDGDVDILIGAGGNMFTDWSSEPIGVLSFEDRSAFDVAIGTKTKRSIARLTKTDLSIHAQTFLTSESGRAVLASAIEIAYNSALELSQTVVAQFNQAIKGASFGVNVTLVAYDSADLATNASILLGFDGVQSQLTQVISVNGVDKNLDKMATSAVVDMVYAWMQTEDAINALVEPSVDETANRVVVGWWSYYATNPGDKSGLVEDQVTAYATALQTYLEGLGYENVQIVVVAFNDSTAKNMGDSIRAYNEANPLAPIDIMLGVGSNFNLSTGANITTASMRGVYKVNNVSSRYFATVQKYDTNTQLVKDTLDWTISEAGLATLGSVTKTK